MSDFDIEAVRAQFPALAGDQVFFDNAGGSQTLGTVIEAIRDYFLRSNVQLGGTYKTGKLTSERYDAAWAAGARYVNADESEIVFGASTTQLFRNLSFTLSFEEGDEVIISSIDHEANIAPWVDLASRQKLVLKWWTPSLSSSTNTNPNPLLLSSDLDKLLTPRTRLVACTHVSNILGSINDIGGIVASVRRGPSPQALVVVDGVSYAPHRPLDLGALGVDAYAFSWYKVYGPHIAMLYVGRRAQDQMRTLGHFFRKSNTLEEKIGLAGASYELLHSLSATTAYLPPSPGHSRWGSLASHEETLQKALLGYLVSRDDVTVYGDTTGDSAVRVSTISFRVAGWKSQEVVETVESASAFGFRWGAFYSVRLVSGLLGLDDDGIVRVSMVHYNSIDEVKSFIAAMEKYIPKQDS
ncbi:aminotransferase class-V [Xylaria digitata]|nr:aminotransferase class-V [Xylaria digitata]